tara:strand:- start:211 stop:345 length:135 start_codon:yes stop_codon:yes gene_type:complete
MSNKYRVNLFTGWTSESQRQLIRDLKNITPSKLSFEKLMKELMQ